MEMTAERPMTPDTTKAKLVTILCGSELEVRLRVELTELGCLNGYTLVRATGRGTHGPRATGLIDAGNVRIELLVAPAREQAIMAMLARSFQGDALTAFAHDVDAFPAKQFA
jgi:hypothetical protein